MLINFLGGSMDKQVKLDSKGYIVGKNLTPAQEQHNLNLKLMEERLTWKIINFGL